MYTPKFYKVCAFNLKVIGLNKGKTMDMVREVLVLQQNMAWNDAKKLRGTTKGLFIVPQSRFIENVAEEVVSVPTLATKGVVSDSSVSATE